MNFIYFHNKWEEKRNIQLLSFVNCNHDARAVDLGCGDGEFSVKVKEQICCKEIYGTEIWDDAIKKFGEKG